MNHHSVVVCTRARGMLFLITNVNTLANFSRRFVALAVKMHGLRFLAIKDALDREDDNNMHLAIALAVHTTMLTEPEFFYPQWEAQKAVPVETDSHAYDVALCALNADADINRMTWDRLPMILVLRVIKIQGSEAASNELEPDTFIWMRPALRIQHQPTGPITSPFGFGRYAVWI